MTGSEGPTSSTSTTGTPACEDAESLDSPDGRDSEAYKIGRLIQRYGLDGVGAELETRWTAERGERHSLRDLADFFNQRLLETAMREAGIDTLEGEVANTYRLLTDDEVTTGMVTETRRKLERGGVDVDRLTTDFVSYQAIRTYLTKYRGATYPPSDASGHDHVERAADNIERLRSRTVTVAEDRIDQLVKRDRLDVGPYHLSVDIRVYCEDCESRYDVDDLFERGGCSCSADD
jgi:hypothetical protein